MMLADNKMGAAGARVVIEEFLDGEEASFIVLVRRPARAGAGQQPGPQTAAGTAIRAPTPAAWVRIRRHRWSRRSIHAKVMREVIQPAINGMEKDGMPYTGFLYAGLMIGTDGQIKVLEFNCRMGDPETQPIMMRLKSDLVYADRARSRRRAGPRRSRVGPAGGAGRGAGRARLSGQPAQGRRDQGVKQCRARTFTYSTPARRSRVTR